MPLFLSGLIAPATFCASSIGGDIRARTRRQALLEIDVLVS
jgi:hypothetical protein